MMLGLGTAALGRPQYINIRHKETSHQDLESFKHEGRKVLDQAYQSGIRYFDTAPGYGLAEGLLLEWLHTKNDGTIKTATKWGYTYVANFDKNAKIHEVKEHSVLKLNEQWNVSKGFLPHLKVYQIHSATFETGVLENQEILERLAFLKDEYDLEIGITTTGANHVEVLKKALDVSVNSEQLFDAFQVTYNILDQSINSISDELKNQNKSIIIKEALANGRLFKNSNYKHYSGLYTTLEIMAKKHNVGIDAIVLKFCQLTIPKSIVLSGASNSEQLESNLKVNKISLSVEELDQLKQYGTDLNSYWHERKQLIWN